MKTKYHPILFSTPMVQGIDENRKTQTRRTKGLEEINKNPDEWEFWRFFDGHAKFVEKHNSTNEKFVKCPYEVGDVLWVRETFQIRDSRKPNEFFYKAIDIFTCAGWKPSLFMPKIACRTFLKIKSIRAERLLDISKQDAIAEGVEFELIDNIKEYKNYMRKSKKFSSYNDYSYPETPNISFMTLWESINGKESLDKNPFVWVYEFERIEKPEDFI